MRSSKKATQLDPSVMLHQLRKRYGTDGEIPVFPLVEWRRAIVFDETRLGYWEWVAWMIERDGSHILNQHSFKGLNNVDQCSCSNVAERQ